MCLYTKYIKNPKYLPNKKNGGCPPPCPDERLKYVPVKCGKCMECRKQKQREWITRLSEEWKANPKDLKFITLTINDKSFYELREYNSETENDLCKKAVRRWLERIRKKTGKSVKHWFVTELGEKKGRIHLHGFVWANAQLIYDTWKYGHIFIGNFVNEKSIFYMTKYMLKQNPIDKSFIGKVLCSAGIGGSYVKSINACNNTYKKGATKEFYNSTISKMLDLVENASSQKANSEKFITKFAKIYTPIVIFLAVIVAILPPLIINYSDPATWANYIRTAASFLVISCPCALVLSVPMSYFVSLGEASKIKVLIKGSTYLDKFTKLNNIVLDKTGTITKGNFVINEIKTQDNFDKNELLLLAQYGEYYSNHPIALAIIQDKKDTLDKNLLTNYQEIEGRGVKVNYNNKELLVGNAKLLKENNIEFINVDSPFTLIYVAYDHKYLGYIEIKDQIKETSINAIKNYHKNGIKNVVMLTGDNDKIAEAVSKEAGVDKYYANLLPLDKTSKLEEIIKSEGKNTTAFVGDGINDAPSLTKADIGISMGGIGSDITIDSSDVVIMDDDLNKVNKVIKIAKKNKLVVIENITFAILVKVLVMILSLIPNLPITPYIMWLAIFADVGVTVICVLNSLRLSLNFKKLNK